MARFILRRLIETPLVLLTVLAVVFVCLLVTGDPVDMLAPPEATLQDREQIRRSYHLDEPLVVQFVGFVAKAAQGDFGRSFFKGKPARDLVLERFPASLQLALASSVIAIAGGVPLGILAAMKRSSWVDQLAMGVALFGQSIASFWLGLLLILVFGVFLRWLPVSGYGGPQHLVLPAVALSFWLLALLARLT